MNSGCCAGGGLSCHLKNNQYLRCQSMFASFSIIHSSTCKCEFPPKPSVGDAGPPEFTYCWCWCCCGMLDKHPTALRDVEAQRYRLQRRLESKKEVRTRFAIRGIKTVFRFFKSWESYRETQTAGCRYLYTFKKQTKTLKLRQPTVCSAARGFPVWTLSKPTL